MFTSMGPSANTRTHTRNINKLECRSVKECKHMGEIPYADTHIQMNTLTGLWLILTHRGQAFRAGQVDGIGEVLREVCGRLDHILTGVVPIWVICDTHTIIIDTGNSFQLILESQR